MYNCILAQDNYFRSSISFFNSAVESFQSSLKLKRRRKLPFVHGLLSRADFWHPNVGLLKLKVYKSFGGQSRCCFSFFLWGGPWGYPVNLYSILTPCSKPVAPWIRISIIDTACSCFLSNKRGLGLFARIV